MMIIDTKQNITLLKKYAPPVLQELGCVKDITHYTVSVIVE